MHIARRWDNVALFFTIFILYLTYGRLIRVIVVHSSHLVSNVLSAMTKKNEQHETRHDKSKQILHIYAII